MIKIFFLIIPFLFSIGCKDKKTLSFCEGLSPKGEKLNCGSVFTTGDLTAVIETDKPFGFTKLNISVSKIEKLKNKPIRSFSSEVKADDMKAGIPLSFYNEGVHKIEILDKEKNTFASGEVKIIDTY